MTTDSVTHYCTVDPILSGKGGRDVSGSGQDNFGGVWCASLLSSFDHIQPFQQRLQLICFAIPSNKTQSALLALLAFVSLHACLCLSPFVFLCLPLFLVPAVVALYWRFAAAALPRLMLVSLYVCLTLLLLLLVFLFFSRGACRGKSFCVNAPHYLGSMLVFLC